MSRRACTTSAARYVSPVHRCLPNFIPAAAPAILVGARLILGVSLVMAIIAEMIGNPQGLGHAIIRDMQAFQPEKMFANVFIVGIWGRRLNASLLGCSAVGRSRAL